VSAAAPADARPLARGLGAATLGLALGALLLARGPATRGPAPVPPPLPLPRRPMRADANADANADTYADDGTAAPRAAPSDPADAALPARRLYQAAALLAASVLSDSALEHYRGDFENPGMFAPLASAAVVLACALRAAWPPARRGRAPGHRPRAIAAAAILPGTPAQRPVPRTSAGILSGVPYATACAVGAAGLGFHAYNVLRRPGGLSWANLFYAAPLGAPAALALAGVIGLAARPVAAGAPTLAGLPSGRALCGLAAFGLAGTSAEAALLHFRGAFQHPAMWVPVSVPPVTAVMLAGAALPGAPGRRRLTNALLRACTWLGVLGMGFHARGIARQMGGWRNWSQNVLAGPPLPAPPSFSALALAGRAALALRAAQEGWPREAT
jgi:hypothetical protein